VGAAIVPAPGGVAAAAGDVTAAVIPGACRRRPSRRGPFQVELMTNVAVR